MEYNTIDRVLLGASSGLVLFSVVVLGVLEILAGKPYSPVEITNEAGEVVATPAIDPTIRTGLVLLGLAVLLVWFGYRALVPADAGTSESIHSREQTAD
ncbi:hypothetical protein [Halapricum desulfuricans]|uniref:Putative membrane protein n=1 Tax=Halapricum desulfuricans TaxID=2841257 RepID=A0A897NT20_9EURY|nr:hypothetical protein [Halapricum desulfuricans]QSG15958.1 putative membrane protein [Halapricum desulfuricans]